MYAYSIYSSAAKPHKSLGGDGSDVFSGLFDYQSRTRRGIPEKESGICFQVNSSGVGPGVLGLLAGCLRRVRNRKWKSPSVAVVVFLCCTDEKLYLLFVTTRTFMLLEARAGVLRTGMWRRKTIGWAVCDMW